MTEIDVASISTRVSFHASCPDNQLSMVYETLYVTQLPMLLISFRSLEINTKAFDPAQVQFCKKKPFK
jgi:hypothetical protein